MALNVRAPVDSARTDPTNPARDPGCDRHPRRMGLRRGAIATALTLVVLVGGLGAPGAPPSAGAESAARGGCGTGRVALTFDDGPAAPTGRLLRILRRAHVPATFFVVGQRAAASPDLTRRIERSGFLLANHSWAHAAMTSQSYDQVRATLLSTDRLLKRLGTHPTRLMRPPYGALDETARNAIRSVGMRPVLWTIDSRDWTGGTAGQIAARILAGLRPHATNIVLQHDGVGHSPVSVEAVPIVIREARRRGYCFTALDEQGRPGFPTPRVSVRVSDTEEGDRAVARVRLSKPPGRPTSVRLRTVGLSATVGPDVERIDRRVTIPAGRLSARVAIDVPHEGKDEPREEFAVRIDRPRGLEIGDGRAVARIRDKDPAPRLLADDATVQEPATGSADVEIDYALARRSGKPVVVVVETVAGTAGEADYTPLHLRFELAPGERRFVVPLSVLADLVDEGDETLTLEVVRARNVRITPGTTVTVTITPPDPPAPPRQRRR